MVRGGEEKIAVSLEANDSIVCEEDVQSLLDLCDQSLLAMLSSCACLLHPLLQWLQDNKQDKARTNTSHRAREQRVHLILHLLWVMQQVLLLVMQRKRQRRITTYHSNRPFSLLPHRLVFLHHSLHHLHDLTLHHRGRHIHHKLRGHQLCVQRVPFLPLTHTHHHHLKHALDDLALLRLDSLTVYQFWVYRITRQCG